jgi:hypothetical protein
MPGVIRAISVRVALFSAVAIDVATGDKWIGTAGGVAGLSRLPVVAYVFPPWAARAAEP